MTTKPKVEHYLSNPIFQLVVGLLLIGIGFGLFELRTGNNLSFLVLMIILLFSGTSAVLYGVFKLSGKETGRQLIGKTFEDYLSSPIFPLVTGLLLGGFGLFSTSIAGGDVLFHVLALVLTIFGFSVAAYGLMGVIEGKEVRRLTKKSELKEVRTLSQSLKVRYPTYTLKVHKLKEKHEMLHEKFPEVRAYAEEFKHQLKAFESGLAELETQLHDNLKKHAPLIDNDNVDGVAKKIIWSDKQLALTQLGTALKTLAETESPVVPENYRSVLSQIRKDFKKLDGGVTLYHELLTTCTRETDPYDVIQALKEEVEGIDALIAQHEAELQRLETSTLTQYEMSKMALSMFQERFDEFKAGCEV